MKRVFFLYAIATTLLAGPAMAQIQKGHVRTINRPGQQVQRLPAVTLQFSGGGNRIVSNNNGDFEAVMSGLKNGDAFRLLLASKSGYELLERNQRFNFSDHEEVEIVMANTRLLSEEQQRIANNARRVAERNYSSQIEQLSRQLEEKTISEQAFVQRVEELESERQKFLALAGTLADRYARTDYQSMTELDQQINMAIEAGDLLQADSLIKADNTFNAQTAVQDRRAAEAELAQRQAIIDRERERIAADEQRIRERGEHDAQRFYQRYTIALGTYQKDSACFYICQRAELDTMNVVRMLEAANFLTVYMADYDKAISYAERAYNSAVAQYGREHAMTAYCLNDMANPYKEKGMFDKALELLRQSLDIRRAYFGEKSKEVAKCYSSMSVVYMEKDQMDLAQQYIEKALHISQQIDDADCALTASFLLDLGGMEDKKGNTANAIGHFKTALPMLTDCKGEDNSLVAQAYNNLGNAYQHVDSFQLAMNCYERALRIKKQLYGENHPDVALMIDNIGTLFSKVGRYEEAHRLHTKALDIRLAFFGEQNTEVGHCYNNMASALFHLQRIDEALQYQYKAFHIDSLFFGEVSSHVANDYGNLSTMFNEKQEHEKALAYAQRELDIYTILFGDNHVKTARAYGNVADCLTLLHDYDRAIENHEKALAIYKQAYGEQHSAIATIYNNLANCYRQKGDHHKEVEMLQQSLLIAIHTYGTENHPSVATVYSNLAMGYLSLDDYPTALDYADKYSRVVTDVFGEESERMQYCHLLLATIYSKKKDYVQAIEAYGGYVTLARKFYGDDSNEVLAHLMRQYQCYEALLQTAPTEENKQAFKAFMADKHFVTSIANNQGIAAARGLTGTYHLLRYCEWDIAHDGEQMLLTTLNSFREKEKTIVLYRDGQVVEETFSEQTLGTSNYLEYITPAEKQQLIEQYLNH